MPDLISAIEDITGPKGVLTGGDVRARPAAWLRREPCRAAAIVRPATTAEVSAVLALCHAASQPVVPLGGNTGLVEGTLADDGILLSLERMNAIEALDPAGATMTVQAGVPLQVVQERAADAGFMFALDLGARGSATIGGNIATNAGGNAVIRYGMMREQVLGLEAVLADGTVLSSMNRMLKNNAGYDLKQLFIGTEGTIGIVTRAVLRLRPAPSARATAFVSVEEYAHVPELLRALGVGLGGELAAFEVLWRDFYDTVVVKSSRHVPPIDAMSPYYVLIETEGSARSGIAERLQSTLEAALADGLISDAALAHSERQREALWAIRDDIEALVEALHPAVTFDVSLPISDAGLYTAAVNRRLAERWPNSFRGTTFGHLGDGNVHFLLTVGSDREEERRAVMDIVYDELVPYGGSISAEHGIGLEKRPYLSRSRSRAEIAAMKRLKKAFDPKGILNPGKVVDIG